MEPPTSIRYSMVAIATMTMVGRQRPSSTSATMQPKPKRPRRQRSLTALAGDAIKVPSDCQHQKNIEVRFEEKLPLKSPDVNVRLHAEGKDYCHDLKTGQNVRCDFWPSTYSVFVVFLPAPGRTPVRAYAYLNDLFNFSGN